MTTLITKNSSTTAAIPTTSDLVQGELAVNVTDKRIFTEDASTQIVELGTNPSTLTTATATVTGTLTANGTLASSNAVVTGGSIDNAPIGATTPSTVAATTVTATTYTGALASAVTATTQAASDNSTKVATTAYVDASSAAHDSLPEVLVVGNTTGGTDLAVSAGDDITFADNSKALFGAGSDLQIFHSGTESFIREVGDGGLKIDTNGPDITLRVNATETALVATSNGAVTAYYDNAAKLATTATGIDVTGTATMDGLTVDGNAKISDTLPRLVLDETDTVDLNTALRNNSGVLKVQTVNDAATSFTSRLDVDHSTGDISFYEDTGTTAAFFWDASTECLGLGTTVPSTSYAIDASKGVRSSGAAPNFTLQETDAANQTWLMGSYAGDFAVRDITGGGYPLKIEATSPTNTLYLDSSGNVGIGTAAPSTSKLHIQGSTGTASAVRAEATGVDSDAYFIADNDASVWTWGIDGGVSDAWILSNAFGLGTPKLTVTTGGNVGIGTSAPAEALSVVGDSIFTNDTAVTFGYRGTAGSTALAFRDRFLGAETMRIDSSGNLLVGTTTILTAESNVEGISLAAGSYGGLLSVSRDGNRAATFNRSTSDGDIIEFRKDGTTVGSIGSNSGDVYIGTGVAGVKFADANPSINPHNTTTNATADNSIDLGTSSARWKDLYLSGTATVGGLISTTLGTNNFVAGSTAGDSIIAGGNDNTLVGDSAGTAVTTGTNNVALGRSALKLNTTGALNTALGAYSLDANTTASNNTAVGYASLGANTTGSENTALGRNALYLNTTASNNTAVGYSSLGVNSTGNYNVAVGSNALDANTTASNNTAIGRGALTENTTGATNVAVGTNALDANTTASSNTAVGYASLGANTTGAANVALGSGTLDSNTTSDSSTAIGTSALGVSTGAQNTALGRNAGVSVTTGSNLTLIGYNAQPSAATATNEMTFGDTNVTLNRFNGDVTLSGGLNVAAPTVPASAAATGTTGDIAWDADYVYVCTATNTWKRTAIATW